MGGGGNVPLGTRFLGPLPRDTSSPAPQKQAEVGVAGDWGVGTASGLIHESEQLETVEGL